MAKQPSTQELINPTAKNKELLTLEQIKSTREPGTYDGVSYNGEAFIIVEPTNLQFKAFQKQLKAAGDDSDLANEAELKLLANLCLTHTLDKLRQVQSEKPVVITKLSEKAKMLMEKGVVDLGLAFSKSNE